MEKKLFAILMSIVILTAFSGIASAENLGSIFKSTSPIKDGMASFVTDFDEIKLMSVGEADEAGALEAIRKGVVQHSTEINIAEYNIPVSNLKNQYNNILNKASYMFPEMFCVSNGYSYYSNGEIIDSILLTYADSLDSANKKLSLYNTFKANILSNITPEMTDLEKLITVHDYMAMYLEYDTSYQVYDAVNMALSGVGVCQGYVQMFYDICSDLGISCGFVTREPYKDSNGQNHSAHIWNVVKLNNQWYNVDVTHDDPLVDIFGRVNHTHFLVSDDRLAVVEEASELKESPVACTDTSFDSPQWNNQWFSPIVVYNHFLYTIKGTQIIKIDPVANTSEAVYNFEYYFEIGFAGSTFNGELSGLGIYEGYLYFNTPLNEVYKLNLENVTEVTLVETFNPTGAEMIQSLGIDRGILACGIAYDGGTISVWRIPLSDEPKFEIIGMERFGNYIYTMFCNSSSESLNMYIPGENISMSADIGTGFGRRAIEYSAQSTEPVRLFLWTKALQPVVKNIEIK